MNSFRVMSFNIRMSAVPDGPNHWNFRKDLWAQTVRAFDPDLMGLQEGVPDQYDHIVEIFPDYGPVGVARGDGVRQDEWALILYRRDRFEKIAGGDFWLSETPEIPGSKSWDSKHVRICTWALLNDRKTNRQLLHANTHMDNEGVQAQPSARLIREKIQKLARRSHHSHRRFQLRRRFRTVQNPQPAAAD